MLEKIPVLMSMGGLSGFSALWRGWKEELQGAGIHDEFYIHTRAGYESL